MAVILKSTKGASTHGVKMLVYGQAGAGKTTLVRTLPNPIILSAEGGLLSLADSDVPFIEIGSMDALREAYSFLMSPEGQKFDSIALDSISEIAEVCLNAAKKTSKDGRAAYGEMSEQVTDFIRAFRDIPEKNIYFSAKLEKMNDEMGKILYSPSMPGNKTGQALPYHFDLVMALRLERGEDGKPVRALMCESDGLWQAKDRSGKLDAWEAPDLGEIIKKVKS